MVLNRIPKATWKKHLISKPVSKAEKSEKLPPRSQRKHKRSTLEPQNTLFVKTLFLQNLPYENFVNIVFLTYVVYLLINYLVKLVN